MSICKLVVIAGVTYLVYKHRDKIIAKAKQVGIINVVPEPSNEQAQ